MVHMSSQSIPVTFVSGYKGVGKSTLVRNLRAQPEGAKLLVVEDNGEEDLIELVTDAVKAVEDDGAIIIECAPNLEPYPALEYFEENPLPQGIRIDALVTVVDASRFLRDVFASKDLRATGLAIDTEDDRSVSEVLLEQIEFADIIVLNKLDLIDPGEVPVLSALLHRLNPRAGFIPTQRGVVNASDLLRQEAFHIDQTDAGAGWLAELEGDFDEFGEVDGVSSFTYLEHRPFHPERFAAMLNEFGVPGLVRAKGTVWLASRHNEIGLWTLSGRASLITSAGTWFAATPTSEWPASEADRLEIMQDLVPPFGDRRQEIAFIGIDLPEDEIRHQLNACLLTHQEMRDGPESWQMLLDPLPQW